SSLSLAGAISAQPSSPQLRLQLELQSYFRDRVKMLSRLKAMGVTAYPKFSISMNLKEYREKYRRLDNGKQMQEVRESLDGSYLGTDCISKLILCNPYGLHIRTDCISVRIAYPYGLHIRTDCISVRIAYPYGLHIRSFGFISKLTHCSLLYMTYADYEDMMELTEQMLSVGTIVCTGLVKELTGNFIIKCPSNGLDKEPIDIDFTPPFRRMVHLEELEKQAGISMPKDLGSVEANDCLKSACERPPHRTSIMLDKLVDHFLVPSCINPTFIINHPRVMSLMAKSHELVMKVGLTQLGTRKWSTSLSSMRDVWWGGLHSTPPPLTC
ncbi:hypothetical protein V2J09_013855, partial [Rumex salicifolius]